MSYEIAARPQATAGLWDAIFGGGNAVDKDLQPSSTTDFIKLKQKVRDQLMVKFGPFKNPDGSPMRGKNNMIYPALDQTNAEALIKAWRTLVLGMMSELDRLLVEKGYGPMDTPAPQTGGYAALSIGDKLRTILSRFDGRVNTWKMANSVGSIGGTAAQFKAAEWLFNDVLGNLVVELSNAVWVKFNIETAWQRTGWAIVDQAAAASGAKIVYRVFDASIEAVSQTAKLTKYAIIGGAGLGALWLVLQMKKKETR